MHSNSQQMEDGDIIGHSNTVFNKNVIEFTENLFKYIFVYNRLLDGNRDCWELIKKSILTIREG